MPHIYEYCLNELRLKQYLVGHLKRNESTKALQAELRELLTLTTDFTQLQIICVALHTT